VEKMTMFTEYRVMALDDMGRRTRQSEITRDKDQAMKWYTRTRSIFDTHVHVFIETRTMSPWGIAHPKAPVNQPELPIE
jgi:hypothetical protein